MKRGLRRVALGVVVTMAGVLPAAVLGSANPASAATPWSIVGIGLTPGGMASFGHSINAAGDVAATLTTSTAVRDGGLYKAGTLTDLGGLEGEIASEADAINASDNAVGRSGSSAVEYSGGTVIDLLTPNGEFGEAGATGISDANTIVGWVNPASANAPEYAAQFVGNSGTVHLGALPGNGVSIAFGVSNDGTIVGGAVDSSSHEQAVTFSGGAATVLATLPGATGSEADGVSNSGGHIVGFADVSGVQHAVQFSATGAAVDLGSLPGSGGTTAVAVNSADQAVGTSTIPNSNSSTAVLFANGTVTDLNTLLPANSGWSLQLASGINDAGQITGTGGFNGHPEGFVLTPPPPPRPPCAPPTGPVSVLLNGFPVIGPSLALLVCRIGIFLNLNL